MCFPLSSSFSLSEWQCSRKTAFLHFVRYGEFMEMSSGGGGGGLLFTPMHQGRTGCDHAAVCPLMPSNYATFIHNHYLPTTF